MPPRQQAIYNLTHSIINYLKHQRAQGPGVEALLSKLDQMDLELRNVADKPPQGTRHDAILGKAISGITATPLSEIANTLSTARKHLVWREDDGLYYKEDADPGNGYRNCNLHSLLIGPDACGFQQEDFTLGLFMLGPRTLYRDHRHAAPELYINLSDRSGWRFHGDDWQDYPAGSIIWNASNEQHATRVYNEPFISVFAWLENIHSLCEVVAKKDWAAIESSLQAC